MQYLKDTVRDKIYSAAVEEFKAWGYQDSSIRNIANNAGISLGNIYRYYANKEALYIAVVQPLIDDVKQFIDEKYFAAGDDLAQVAHSVAEFMQEHDDEIIILRRGNTPYYKQFAGYLETITAERLKQRLGDDAVAQPDLPKIVARSFLHGLFDVIDSTDDKAKRQACVGALINLYFNA